MLGGTRFVGRAIVESALEHGHNITLVHRGQTGDDLFSGRVKTFHADRLDSLDVAREGTWDACIDTCAYVPRAIRIAGDALAGRVGKYLLISTISVYKDPIAGSNEGAPLIEEGDPDNEVVDSDSYGFLKVLCERETIARFGGESLLVRPGIVIGPHDPTDRFTYWVSRISRGGKVITPAGPDRPVQWIDARDLGEFCIHGLEQSLSGAYHAIGQPSTLRELLQTARAELNPSVEFIERDLEANGIVPWTDLPLVVEPGYGTFRLDPSKATAAGLRTRDLGESVRDTAAWWSQQGRPLKVGLSDERHDELLSSATSAQ